MRQLLFIAALIALAGCERKAASPLGASTPYHGGQAILVMGQSNAQLMAQYEPAILLANAQTLYPGTDHIIDCAVVGSGELTWAPGSVNYQACLQKLRADGAAVAYIIWWQGETEAGPPYPGRGDPAVWGSAFVSLMNQFRAAIGRPAVEVLYARLSDDARAAGYQYWSTIRDQQASVVLSRGMMISVDGIPANAFPHYDEPGYKAAAQRFVP